MEIAAVVLFALAALGGAALAAQRLQGRTLPPTGLAIIHGGVAAAALVLYLLAVLGAAEAGALSWWAVALFVVAALGGAVLFLGFHVRGRALPVPLVFVHGGVAVIAFILLLVAVFGDGAGRGS